MGIRVLLIDDNPRSMFYAKRIELLPPWNEGFEIWWIDSMETWSRLQQFIEDPAQADNLPELAFEIVLLNVEFGQGRRLHSTDDDPAGIVFRARSAGLDLPALPRTSAGAPKERIEHGRYEERISSQIQNTFGDAYVMVRFNRHMSRDHRAPSRIQDVEGLALDLTHGTVRDEFSFLMAAGLPRLRKRIVTSTGWGVGADILINSPQRSLQIPLRILFADRFSEADNESGDQAFAEMKKMFSRQPSGGRIKKYTPDEIAEAKGLAGDYFNYRFLEFYPGRERLSELFATRYDVSERVTADGRKLRSGEKFEKFGPPKETEELRQLKAEFWVRSTSVNATIEKDSAVKRALWRAEADLRVRRLAVLLLTGQVSLCVRHGPGSVRIARILHYLDTCGGHADRQEVLEKLSISEDELTGYLRGFPFWLIEDEGVILRGAEQIINLATIHQALNPAPLKVILDYERKMTTMTKGLEQLDGLHMALVNKRRGESDTDSVYVEPQGCTPDEIEIVRDFTLNVARKVDGCWPKWL
jgi:hypothetical protein